MADIQGRSAYIVMDGLGDAAIREIHNILATFPGTYSLHVTEPDNEPESEETYFPLYVKNPRRDGKGELVGRGHIVDVSDTVTVELEIYDDQIIKKLREFDILDMSMDNIDLMRKEKANEDSE